MRNSRADTRGISGYGHLNLSAFFPLLVIAVIFGGGGVRYGLMNAAVQISAIFVLAFNSSRLIDFFLRAPRTLRILTALSFLLPLLQLLPLPPGLWSVLPGRELESQSLALVNRSDHWMTWTVNPARTLVAFIGLLAPFTILVTAYGQSRDFRHSAFKWIAALGVINILVGAVQLASGRQLLNWYGGGNPDHLYGTFANHNSAGLFLVISLCALIGVRTDLTLSHRMIKAALGILIVSGVFLTQSRSSIALLVIPAFQLLLQYLHRSRDRISIRSVAMTIAPVLLVLGGLGALATGNSKVGDILHRFDDLKDGRPLIWQDTAVAIARYWPMGSGAGTFDEVFQIDESLENVNSHLAGRAHNDYLEILLENGIWGGILAIAWIIYALRLSIAHLYRFPLHLLAPTGILIAISMQSLLDYPLRNQAIMCLAAAMIALLATESERSRER